MLKLLVAVLFAHAAFAQCGPNGTFNGIGNAGDLLCTGKVGAAAYPATFTATTTKTVTAATHGQGLLPVAFCYDNSTPQLVIATTNTVAANGDITISWSGSKTGTCLISALGSVQGIQGIQGIPGVGTPGTNGNTILNGAGVPSSGLGANGDYYIQQTSTTACLWGPKATGTWPSPCFSFQPDLSPALALKAPIDNPTFTGTVGGITQAMVGLPNVDNTSDVNKPVSTATSTALALKAPLTNATMTNITFAGTVTGLIKANVGLGLANNTSDANKPVSTAQQTALDLKADATAVALKAPIANPVFTGVATSPSYEGPPGTALNHTGACMAAASVPNPASGDFTMFCDSSNANHMSRRDSAGVVTDMEAGTGGPGNGTVTVVGSGNLTLDAITVGGGTQKVKTPSATSTMDSSGNMSIAGAFTANSISTGPGAVGALIGTEQTQTAAAALFAGAPGIFFSSGDHIAKYLSAVNTIAGTMVAPVATRTAHRFLTNIPLTGIATDALIDGTDLPLPTTTIPGAVYSSADCPTGQHFNGINTSTGLLKCTADSTTGGSVSVTTPGDLQGRDGSGAARIPVGTEGQVLVARLTAGSGLKVAWEDKPIKQIKVVLDAGEGSLLTAPAMVRCGLVDYAGVIKAATITADTADSVVVDVKTVAYGSYTGPASSSSIAASAKPTLASAATNQDTTLTGWTTALAANTYVCFSMTGATAAKWVEVDLKVQLN